MPPDEEVSTIVPTSDTISFTNDDDDEKEKEKEKEEEEEEEERQMAQKSNYPHRGGKSVLRKNEPTPVIKTSPDTHTPARSAPGRDCCTIL